MQISKLGIDEMKMLLFSGAAPCSPPRYISDDVDTEINFGKYWVPNVKDSYSVMAVGDSMINAGIHSGDMLVIDCGKDARIGNVVAVWLNGDLTIKRLDSDGKTIVLRAENPDYHSILVSESDDFRVLGVITSLHRHL